MAVVIGVDVGTTSTKAIAVSDTGAIVALANRGYPLRSPHPGWAEQDPDAIVAAVLAAVRAVVDQVGPNTVVALGFSTAMHSLILIDRDGTPLTPSLTWADTRSTEQAQALKQTEVGKTLYGLTGAPIHPMLPVIKLLWLRQHQPALLDHAVKAISIKEYVLHRLCGHYVVDYSIASASGFLNVKTLDWEPIALELTGLERQHLSDLVPPTAQLQGLLPAIAAAMGLKPQVTVVVGASDGALAVLGAGATAPGQIAVTVGTSGAVRQWVSTPHIDSNQQTFCYAVTPETWLIGGATNNAGLALQWFRDHCFAAEALTTPDLYDQILELANTVGAGAEGLLFLPFLAGERAPIWNAEARGVWFGLSFHHTRAHLARSVLEGILFSLSSIVSILAEQSNLVPVIYASGGFVRSLLWRQLMADLLGYDILVPHVYEGSVFGAALMTMRSLGWLYDYSDVQNWVGRCDRYTPQAELTTRYRELYALYQRLYFKLVDEFAQLVPFQTPFVDRT